jgi:acetoin utilization protein AcuB
MSNNLVRDWMTSKPITVPQCSPIRDAYWLMIDNKIRRLPVMDNERLVGIITMEDLRRAEPPTGIGLDLVRITDMLSKMTVHQVMSRDPKTITPDATLIEAAQMMLEYRISALPVMDGSQLVGIITESDIFRAFVNMEEGNALHNPRDQRK